MQRAQSLQRRRARPRVADALEIGVKIDGVGRVCHLDSESGCAGLPWNGSRTPEVLYRWRKLSITKATLLLLRSPAMRLKSFRSLALGLSLLVAGSVGPATADDGEQLLSIDHYVPVRSIVPAINGQQTQVYVRERVKAGAALRGASSGIVLFIHGAGTPSEVAFDVPYQDYSWMAYLASAGYDVFSMDTTGYGRSTRPAAMNDPCNLSAEQQKQFVPALIAKPCQPSYPNQLTTSASDWNDVGAVVDYLRSLRRAQRVNLVAWSLGGPRSAGYAAQNPDKIEKLVLLAPAYRRDEPAVQPALPAPGVAFNTQSRADFDANWDRQVGCTDQYDPAASQSVWTNMLASDPVGATWGTGVRRAPQTTSWGWTTEVVRKMQTP